MLEPGDRAPDFRAESSGGSVLALKDFLGKKVVLYFYPKDETPGCTKQACSFRDNLARIEEMGAVVLGVSPDSVSSHDRFTANHELTFPLISDPDHAIAEAYGVWVEKNLYDRKSMGIQRATFLIDETGRVQTVFPKVTVEGHVDQVLEKL